MTMGAGVHLASRPRALLDNTRPTRKRNERPPATLSRAELADWIDHLCAVDGAALVSAYRDTAEGLAGELGASSGRVETLNEIVGAALGTRDSTSGSTAKKARSAGVPFDQGRILRFELLANRLRDVVTTHPALPADSPRRATPLSTPTTPRTEACNCAIPLPRHRRSQRWEPSKQPTAVGLTILYVMPA